MIVEKLPFRFLPGSALFKDYLSGKPELQSLYKLPPKVNSFEEAIADREKFSIDRALLADRLRIQYASYEEPVVHRQIEKLRDENTFTVVTGHQLNLASGPLYFIYKIASVINLARKLNEKYPDKQIIPVYWMATEDHDLEEINHFRFFDRTITWHTDQKGPVGRMNTSGLDTIFGKLAESMPLLALAYKEKTLAAATRNFVHHWFGNEGLLVIDGDDPELKRKFSSHIRRDLWDHTVYQEGEKTAKMLKGHGYGTQIMIRDINLFYMEDGMRERIERDGQDFIVVDSGFRFSLDEMEKLIEESPEKLSPNVALRPHYQEVILPNLAYIGGPAEVAYWLQLKGGFDASGVHFPIIMPRNFAAYLPKSAHLWLQKRAISIESLFASWEELKVWYLERENYFPADLSREKEVVEKLFGSVESKAVSTDQSLKGYVQARALKLMRELDRIQIKIRKAEERKHETELGKLEKFRNQLFPGGVPQERVGNIHTILLEHPEFLNACLTAFDPFAFEFYLFRNNE